MVFDDLSNAGLYSFTNPLLVRGMDFLKTRDSATLPIGRIDLQGDQLFALVQEYPTQLADHCFWEAHRKYIDIQFLAGGVEDIGYAPLDQLKVIQSYDAAKDMMKLDGDGITLSLKAGSFAVFFPHDAHRPCVASSGRPTPVKKVVVKVAMSPL